MKGYMGEAGASHEHTLVVAPAGAFRLAPAALGAARGGGGAHAAGTHLAHDVLEHGVDAPVALGRRLVVRHAPLVCEGLHRLAADLAVGAEVGLGADEDHGDVARAGALDALYLRPQVLDLAHASGLGEAWRGSGQ